MKLRIFSVVGEALNFGGRRMETIARVAWLPVVLLLIVDMATVFSYLSVIAPQTITFAEVPSFVDARNALVTYAVQGWQNDFNLMLLITLVSIVLQTLLVASFMAPLVRLAGLGEEPGPGLIKIAFGPDQMRYILSSILSFLFVALLIFLPMATATYFVLQYILEAMSQTMASFPNPESIHTIKIVTKGEALIAQGSSWIFGLGIPLIAAAPFGLLLWLVAFLHFNPRNRNENSKPNVYMEHWADDFFTLVPIALIVTLLGAPYKVMAVVTTVMLAITAGIRFMRRSGKKKAREAGNTGGATRKPNPIFRAVLSFVLVVVLAGGAYLLLNQVILMLMGTTVGLAGEVAKNLPESTIATQSVSIIGEATRVLANSPVNAALFLGITVYLLIAYFNLRLYAYPGVAVCRKSLALGNTLRVSQGWNIFRLYFLFGLIGAFIAIIQVVFLNGLLLNFIIPQTVILIYSAFAVSTKLLNSGVTAEWVTPVFIWIWNMIKIMMNIIWVFFTYGALAGIYGRLYRDSEREAYIEDQGAEAQGSDLVIA
ncbi:MAG: hypothetical protein DHS20C05_25670 [Hyphococcus sp.]|nr:MAG: hypothetical protein DHS20C05_25670 [Marinicaulis sp.]